MGSTKSNPVTEDQIRSIQEVRKKRSELFGEGLFADAAWDILLELFSARLRGSKVTLDDLVQIGPRSTIARWVSALEQRGLVFCEIDPFRPDCMWIALSRECAQRMNLFLSEARHLSPSA